jgi:hypothetical protein
MHDKSSHLKPRLIVFASALGAAALAGSVLIAFASLTFTGTTISGDTNSAIDATGTVTIGASSATGITIGRSGITATFPGTVTITGTTTTLQNLVVSGACTGCGIGNFTAGGDLSGSSTSQTVTGIQGRAVSSTAPSPNQVLTWNGSFWTPANVSSTGGIAAINGLSNATTSIVGAGTVTVSTSSPNVITITGTGSGAITINSLTTSTFQIQGTANQITVASSAPNIISLSLPQDIATVSTPTFAGLTLTGNATGTSGAFTGNFFVGGNLNTTGTATFASGLAQSGGLVSVASTTINGNATTTGNLVVLGLLLDASGNQYVTSTLTATGTSFYFPYWGSNGNLLTNTSPIYVASSTNYIGIGTTNPQGLLDVVGSSNSTSTLFTGARAMSVINTDTTNGNMAGFDFRTNDASGTLTTGAKMLGVFTSHAAEAVSADLAFRTNNAGTVGEVMRLTGAGNVGIGTTTPSQLLTVAGGSVLFSQNSNTHQVKILGAPINDTVTTNTSTPALYVSNTGTDAELTGQDIARIYSDHAGVSDRPALRIDSYGNVHMTNELSISANPNPIVSLFPGTTQYMFAVLSDENPGDPLVVLRASNNSSSYAAQELIRGYTWDGNISSLLLANGYLGLGTAITAAKVTDRITLPNNSWLAFRNATDAGSIQVIGANSVNKIIVAPNHENVGFGTATANDQVHIYAVGTSRGLLIENDTQTPTLRFYSDSASAGARNWIIRTNQQQFGDFDIGQSTAKGGDTYTGKLHIDNNGNVGIGTSTVSATLQVVGASSTIRIGASALPGCLEMGNSDGSAGINYITVLNGTLTATTTKPSNCQ